MEIARDVEMDLSEDTRLRRGDPRLVERSREKGWTSE